jgi:hypothetical protein
MITMICVCGEAFAVDVPAGSTVSAVHCPHCNAGPLEVTNAPRCAAWHDGHGCELPAGHRGAHLAFWLTGARLWSSESERLSDFKLSILRGK